MITVVIPVGPQSVYKKYLPEALESLKYQTEPPDEILIIDDMADLSVNDLWKQVNTGIVDDILSALS